MSSDSEQTVAWYSSLGHMSVNIRAEWAYISHKLVEGIEFLSSFTVERKRHAWVQVVEGYLSGGGRVIGL